MTQDNLAQAPPVGAQHPAPDAPPDDLIHRLGLLVDKADNYLAYRAAHLPPVLKADAYDLALQDLRAELRRLYFDLGGEDAWHHP